MLLLCSYNSFQITMFKNTSFAQFSNSKVELNTFLLLFKIPSVHHLTEYHVKIFLLIGSEIENKSFSYQSCSGLCHKSFIGLENLNHFLILQYVLLSLLDINFLALMLTASQERLGIFSLMQSHHLMLWASDSI